MKIKKIKNLRVLIIVDVDYSLFEGVVNDNIKYNIKFLTYFALFNTIIRRTNNLCVIEFYEKTK